ncbi:MAG: signal recognition particle-docking protein FtsY [Candidatus Marinimicrobia bacterium]|nr:signal recognition particle-docking protein FtsY [Candidatus Neomarinimicrobiota bacterium]
MSRTREKMSNAVRKIAAAKVSSDSLQEIEALLLSADVGVETTDEIVQWLESDAASASVGNDLRSYLQDLLNAETDESFSAESEPAVVFIVGVNGTGKTTSTAKLAHLLQSSGISVMLVGADTYRAAAVEQLKQWCSVTDVPLVCNESARDPSSVIYDGLEAASARDAATVIIDTAGRLHTCRNLMSEVEKMYRIASTKFPHFSVISYITLDANLGQNSLTQARTFNEHIPLDGVILTKMDGTAKGGIVFPIYRELGIPVRYIGVGETLDDLVEFNAEDYVASLLGLGVE